MFGRKSPPILMSSTQPPTPITTQIAGGMVDLATDGRGHCRPGRLRDCVEQTWLVREAGSARDSWTSALSEALILGAPRHSHLTLCSQTSCEAEEERTDEMRRDSRAGDTGQGGRPPQKDEQD